MSKKTLYIGLIGVTLIAIGLISARFASPSFFKGYLNANYLRVELKDLDLTNQANTNSSVTFETNKDAICKLGQRPDFNFNDTNTITISNTYSTLHTFTFNSAAKTDTTYPFIRCIDTAANISDPIPSSVGFSFIDMIMGTLKSTEPKLQTTTPTPTFTWTNPTTSTEIYLYIKEFIPQDVLYKYPGSTRLSANLDQRAIRISNPTSTSVTLTESLKNNSYYYWVIANYSNSSTEPTYSDPFVFKTNSNSTNSTVTQSDNTTPPTSNVAPIITVKSPALNVNSTNINIEIHTDKNSKCSVINRLETLKNGVWTSSMFPLETRDNLKHYIQNYDIGDLAQNSNSKTLNFICSSNLNEQFNFASTANSTTNISTVTFNVDTNFQPESDERCYEYFTDINNSSLCPELTYLYELGIFTGKKMNNGNYADLNSPLNRAEFFAIADRLNNSNYGPVDTSQLLRFKDITPSVLNSRSTQWWITSLARLYATGSIQGYNDNTIRPSSGITWAELAKITAISSGLISTNDFDSNKNPWYTDILDAYQDCGINYINPSVQIKRGHAVKLIYDTLQCDSDYQRY